MRGQSVIFEQVLLFTVGIAIFITAVGMFDVYSTHYRFSERYDTISGVSDILISGMASIARFDANATVEISIPEKVSGQYYSIGFSGDDMTITTIDGQSLGFRLVLPSQFTVSGGAKSDKGYVILYKKGYNIILS